MEPSLFSKLAFVVLIVAMSGFTSPLRSEETWWVAPERVASLQLPKQILTCDRVFELLGYRTGDAPQPFLGSRYDLNGDGVPEYIVRSTQILCGTGGCAFAVFDGATFSYKGQVFGTMVRARKSKVAGWAVLECFSRTSAHRQTYTVYAVIDSKYRPIADLDVVSELPLWGANP